MVTPPLLCFFHSKISRHIQAGRAGEAGGGTAMGVMKSDGLRAVDCFREN